MCEYIRSYQIIYIYTHTYIHTHTPIYIYINIYIYIYIYRSVSIWRRAIRWQNDNWLIIRIHCRAMGRSNTTCSSWTLHIEKFLEFLAGLQFTVPWTPVHMRGESTGECRASNVAGDYIMTSPLGDESSLIQKRHIHSKKLYTGMINIEYHPLVFSSITYATIHHSSWWCNQVETFSALLALCEENPAVTAIALIKTLL